MPRLEGLGDHPAGPGRVADGQAEGAGQVIGRSQRQDAQGQLGFHQRIGDAVERPVAAGHDHAVDLVPVLADQFGKLAGIVRSLDNEIEACDMEQVDRLRQLLSDSAGMGIREQERLPGLSRCGQWSLKAVVHKHNSIGQCTAKEPPQDSGGWCNLHASSSERRRAEFP